MKGMEHKMKKSDDKPADSKTADPAK